jgi:hypothetical protein
MSDDLDDFEIEPTRRREDEDTVSPYRPPPARKPGGLLFPATLAAVALAAIGLLAIFFFVFRQPAKTAPTPDPTPRAGAPALPEEPLPVPSPAVALPPLEDSDAFVREAAASLSRHPELVRWLARTALVRTLSVVVLNVADGETPRPHLGFLAPQQRFRAARRPGRLVVPDPAGFAGYDRFGDAVGSVDAAAAAGAYRALAPLFDAACVELGRPAGSFPEALDKAIRSLLAVPVPRDDAELVPHAVGFRWADRRLESLTPAQKQLLRTGPRNVRLVQGKLRELQEALAAAAPP